MPPKRQCDQNVNNVPLKLTFAFGFPDITLVTIFAWDRVDGATIMIFRYWVFRFRKQIPDGLVWFVSNFDVVITQDSFDRLRCALDVW